MEDKRQEVIRKLKDKNIKKPTKEQFENLKRLSRILGLIVGTAGIIIGFWDKATATYFVVIGMWLFLICGE